MPLLFADAADRERVAVGDRWHIHGVADAVGSGAEELNADIEHGEPIALRLLLTREERDILAAGGLLRQARADARPLV